MTDAVSPDTRSRIMARVKSEGRKPEMYALLPRIHILAGFCCLLTAFCAMLTRKGQAWQVYSGRGFFWGMLVIFITALPMILLRTNLANR